MYEDHTLPVSMEVLRDRTLSRDARLLYVLLHSNLDRPWTRAAMLEVMSVEMFDEEARFSEAQLDGVLDELRAVGALECGEAAS